MATRERKLKSSTANNKLMDEIKNEIDRLQEIHKRLRSERAD